MGKGCAGTVACWSYTTRTCVAIEKPCGFRCSPFRQGGPLVVKGPCSAQLTWLLRLTRVKVSLIRSRLLDPEPRIDLLRDFTLF